MEPHNQHAKILDNIASQNEKQREVDRRLSNVRRKANSYMTPTSKKTMVSSFELGNVFNELPNTEDNIRKALETLEQITFDEIVKIAKFDSFFEEDAGGQYIMAVKEEFLEIVRKMFNGMSLLPSFSHPYNYVLGVAGDKVLERMDTVDKHDVMMSIAGDEYAERTDDAEPFLRTIAKALAFILWERATTDNP